MPQIQFGSTIDLKLNLNLKFTGTE